MDKHAIRAVRGALELRCFMLIALLGTHGGDVGFLVRDQGHLGCETTGSRQVITRQAPCDPDSS